MDSGGGTIHPFAHKCGLVQGDQASIVGGAIEFVKELDQLLQSLEAKKRQMHQGGGGAHENKREIFLSPQFAQFFTYPQYLWCQNPCMYPVENMPPAIADIEVILIETHANLRILSRRRPRQLFKLVAGFQALRLSILHLNVTTMDHLVLYSFNVKVEQGAVYHRLRIIEDEDEAALSS